jgi:immune inhibitor A
VGVFAHEYGHDLGLPDLYDYYGTNAVGFWSLMGSGSWLSQSDQDIGSAPDHLGVWEKFQLGWLNYEVAYAGYKSEHKLGPAETNTKQAQGLFVVLPDKAIPILDITPYSGEYAFWGGSGHNLDNWMYKAFTIPGTGATLTAMVNFDIETDWDYAYVVASDDGGATWQNVLTNFSTSSDPNGQNFGHGITGFSGGWATLSADLSGFAGDDILLGFRYWTDVAVAFPGFVVDDIAIPEIGFFDDVESGEGDWTLAGFSISTGFEAAYYFNAYVAEFRQYRGYDKGLANAYHFGFGTNWVERYPYQDGLLISYWDTSFTNNDVTWHCIVDGRCGGLLLPVDAHPEAMYRANGNPWYGHVQTYDATYGLEPTDAITLHTLGDPSHHPSLPAVPIFDDNLSYYDPAIPTASVMTPQTGTQIRVKSISAHGSFMQVEVRPSK